MYIFSTHLLNDKQFQNGSQWKQQPVVYQRTIEDKSESKVQDLNTGQSGNQSKSNKWILASAHEGLITMVITVHCKQLENWKKKWNDDFQKMDSRRKMVLWSLREEKQMV